jgi:hypothetical protein
MQTTEYLQQYLEVWRWHARTFASLQKIHYSC